MVVNPLDSQIDELADEKDCAHTYAGNTFVFFLGGGLILYRRIYCMVNFELQNLLLPLPMISGLMDENRFA